MSLANTPKRIVIDAAPCIYLVLGSSQSEAIFGQWENWLRRGYQVCAPHFWVNEITSAIHKMVSLRMINEARGLQAIDAALELEIELVGEDTELCRSAFTWATRLGYTSAYDSFYLALADRTDGELWTTDQHLGNRARQVGSSRVKLFT